MPDYELQLASPKGGGVVAPVKPLRPIGKFERYNITRNYLGFYNNVGTTATYAVPLRLFSPESGNKYFESVILTALIMVLQRHSILGVGIKGEETATPEWVRLGDNKTRAKWSEAVTFLNLIDWKEDGWVEDAHQVPFLKVAELPLWRILVTNRSLEQSDGKLRFRLGFFFHHAIGDGISGGGFHIAFRDALNAILAGKARVNTTLATEDEIAFPPIVELIPNLERLHKLPLTLCFMRRMLIQNFVYRKPDPTHWKGTDIPKVISRTPITCIRAFSLDNKTTARLVKRCREEKTTLTSLMSYIIAKKLAVMYPDSKRLSGLVPFSFRRFTKTPDSEFVLQVTTNPIRFTKDPNDKESRFLYLYPADAGTTDWHAVRGVKKQIDDDVKPHDQIIGMLKFIKDLPKYMNGRLGTKRDASFEMSNIGVVDGGNGNGEAAFERMMFSASMNVIGGPFSFCVASAKGGDMTVTLNWEQGVVTREEAEELSQNLEAELKQVADVKELAV